MRKYFLGVDLGGTKSHAIISDQDGQVIGFGKGGPGNPEGIGYEALADLLHEISCQAVANAGIEVKDVCAAGFGIGGYDWPSQRPLNLDTIRKAGLHMPVELVNDALLGLIAGSSQGWGISIVAGTGCNCWGRDQHSHTAQVTGMGTWMGEGAGASELVGRTLQVISRAWSLRGPQTALTRVICDHVGATDAFDLLEGLTVGKYQLRSNAAPKVFEVARSGDPVAMELVHWAGEELGSLGVGVIRQLAFEDMEFEIVISGSFWKGSPLLLKIAADTVHKIAPRARFNRLTAPPVIGGVLLAMEVAGMDFTSAREYLLSSSEIFIHK
jgi:N-acetylglucosamine kinase-like BadF-type ATPase